MMQHIVSLSGGVSSAVTAQRVIDRYGKDTITLWFADTSWEDDDLHRFMADCLTRWGMTMITYRDGRNPLDIADDQNIIPNQRIAPCSQRLKIEPFVKFLATQPKPVTVHLGLDWTEAHRMATPKARYEAIGGVTVDYPLTWEPVEMRSYFDIVQQDWGIQAPRLYTMGFPHNNCGGRCVRQGVSEWLRLKRFFPERFADVRDWESARRAIGDARKDYAICRDQRGGEVRPLPLADIDQANEVVPDALVQEDLFGCFCSY